MKRISPLIPILALFLLLTSCGGSSSNNTAPGEGNVEALTADDAARVTKKISSSFSLLFEEGFLQKKPKYDSFNAFYDQFVTQSASKITFLQCSRLESAGQVDFTDSGLTPTQATRKQMVEATVLEPFRNEIYMVRSAQADESWLYLGTRVEGATDEKKSLRLYIPLGQKCASGHYQPQNSGIISQPASVSLCLRHDAQSKNALLTQKYSDHELSYQSESYLDCKALN